MPDLRLSGCAGSGEQSQQRSAVPPAVARPGWLPPPALQGAPCREAAPVAVICFGWPGFRDSATIRLPLMHRRTPANGWPQGTRGTGRVGGRTPSRCADRRARRPSADTGHRQRHPPAADSLLWMHVGANHPNLHHGKEVLPALPGVAKR